MSDPNKLKRWSNSYISNEEEQDQLEMKKQEIEMRERELLEKLQNEAEMKASKVFEVELPSTPAIKHKSISLLVSLAFFYLMYDATMNREPVSVVVFACFGVLTYLASFDRTER